MGVSGTNCALCGIAVEHLHYVRTEVPNFFKIYRDEGCGFTPAFPFGAEHAWLRRAVVVPEREGDKIRFGTVSDGWLRDLHGHEEPTADRWAGCGGGRRGRPMQSLLLDLQPQSS
jgi:hypothetical protein